MLFDTKAFEVKAFCLSLHPKIGRAVNACGNIHAQNVLLETAR